MKRLALFAEVASLSCAILVAGPAFAGPPPETPPVAKPTALEAQQSAQIHQLQELVGAFAKQRDDAMNQVAQDQVQIIELQKQLQTTQTPPKAKREPTR